MINYIMLITLAFMLTTTTSCNNGGNMTQQTSTFPSIKDVPASAWEKLAQKKIYFGHQSVGYNIIDGIKDVMKENPQIKLNIIETSNPADFNSGIFAHSEVGKNRDPESKVNEFITFMEQGIGDKADIAALKFCYVDITADSNVEDIFKYYERSISQLKLKYPRLTIVHFTTPLTTIQPGPKALIKRIIGRSIDGIDDNIKRNAYNEMLLKKYEGKESVFDLAGIESTLPDGKRSALIKDGKSYYSLFQGYTDDGGHLNHRSSKIVGERLLIFLAELN